MIDISLAEHSKTVYCEHQDPKDTVGCYVLIIPTRKGRLHVYLCKECEKREFGNVLENLNLLGLVSEPAQEVVSKIDGAKAEAQRKYEEYWKDAQAGTNVSS